MYITWLLEHMYAGDNPKCMRRNKILASPPVPFGAIGFTWKSWKNGRLYCCTALIGTSYLADHDHSPCV